MTRQRSAGAAELEAGSRSAHPEARRAAGDVGAEAGHIGALQHQSCAEGHLVHVQLVDLRTAAFRQRETKEATCVLLAVVFAEDSAPMSCRPTHLVQAQDAAPDVQHVGGCGDDQRVLARGFAVGHQLQAATVMGVRAQPSITLHKLSLFAQAWPLHVASAPVHVSTSDACPLQSMVPESC